jgi:hypothetical protein
MSSTYVTRLQSGLPSQSPRLDRACTPARTHHCSFPRLQHPHIDQPDLHCVSCRAHEAVITQLADHAPPMSCSPSATKQQSYGSWVLAAAGSLSVPAASNDYVQKKQLRRAHCSAVHFRDGSTSTEDLYTLATSPAGLSALQQVRGAAQT